MPQRWITCGEALKIARFNYGLDTDFCISHPAHIAVFRGAGDGALSLKAEAITAHFDGSVYAMGKAKTDEHLLMQEQDVELILRITADNIYNILNKTVDVIFTVKYWDIVISVFELQYNGFDDFFTNWTLRGLFFEKSEIEYLFCNDDLVRKRLLRENNHLSGKGPVPFSDQERRLWIERTTERNADKAYNQYKHDPRYDGTKQYAWRTEWSEIHGRKRGRPRKNVE
jgi:hypothetical protein